MEKIILENELYFAKIRDSAVIPSKKAEDAGYDIYSNFEDDYFVIEAGETRAVPTGIAAAFSSKYYIQIEERSGMAKNGIKKSGGVMDSGYRGEYLILLFNTKKVPFVISKIAESEMADEFEAGGKTYKKSDCFIYPYSKAIAQLVIQEVPVMEEKQVSYEELMQFTSDRGVGGFGHTGK